MPQKESDFQMLLADLRKKVQSRFGDFEKQICNAVVRRAKVLGIRNSLLNEGFRDLYVDIAYSILYEFEAGKTIEELSVKLQSNLVEWESFDDLKVRREVEEKIGDANVEDGIYECQKCHSKKTISTKIQTRSADEGMTTFVKCVKCSNVWKIFA